MTFWSRNWKGLTLSVLFVLALYGPAVSGQRFFFERDVWLYWVPHIEWAVRAMAAGQLPQWNPLVAFGAPFLADPSFQFFYPPSIVNWLAPPRFAYTVLVVGHSLFGAVGAFRLLRPRLRSSSSALLGAIAFVGAGPIVSSANLWHHFCSAMYMPWVLDAFLRLRGGGGRGGVKRLGLFAGLQALAGSADVCVMTGLGLALLLPRRYGRLVRLLPKLAAAAGLCVLLAAVQWLPTTLLATRSSRASLETSGRLHWSVPPSSLVDLLLPLNGSAHARPEDLQDLEEPLRLIQWMYMGASTLPLLVLGLARAPRGGMILGLAVLLALGRHTPLAGWVGQLPVIASFRFPSKLLWLVSGCWAALCAIGFKTLTLEKRAPIRVGSFVGAGILFGGLALPLMTPWGGDSPEWTLMRRLIPNALLALGGVLLSISLRTPWTPQVVLLLAGVDLLGTCGNFNAYASEEMFTTRPAIVDELDRSGARRVYVDQRSIVPGQSWKSPANWTDKESYYFALGQVLLPPQSVRWGIRGSFDGDFTGLARKEYSLLSDVVRDAGARQPEWLALAGVTHVIVYLGKERPELAVAAKISTFREIPVLVLRVGSTRPTAYMVTRIRTATSPESAIRVLGDPDFDPRSEIVRVSGAMDTPPKPMASDLPEGLTGYEHHVAGRFKGQTRFPVAGTLVVLNAYSEGWEAKVDGQPRPVVPANLIFQSVELEPGEHTVELEYQTPGLKLGASLSAIAWALLAVASAQPRKKRPLD